LAPLVVTVVTATLVKAAPPAVYPLAVATSVLVMPASVVLAASKVAAVQSMTL
jgi:hypothetical protein